MKDKIWISNLDIIEMLKQISNEGRITIKEFVILQDLVSRNIVMEEERMGKE